MPSAPVTNQTTTPSSSPPAPPKDLLPTVTLTPPPRLGCSPDLEIPGTQEGSSPVQVLGSDSSGVPPSPHSHPPEGRGPGRRCGPHTRRRTSGSRLPGQRDLGSDVHLSVSGRGSGTGRTTFVVEDPEGANE